MCHYTCIRIGLTFCFTDINQRLNARYDCENGGLGFNTKKCACPAGFTGDRCEIGNCIFFSVNLVVLGI